MNKNEITLKVNGKSYGGWTSATVEKSLFNLTGAFGLAATDIYPGQLRKWEIKLGDQCTVQINKQTIITGYIEDIPISYDATSHNIQFGGRDKTGDLVDCSFDGDANEWDRLNIISIIRKICDPFGISVAVDYSVINRFNVPWPENFVANEGDTAFDLISKLCKMNGILPVSYGDGYLTLTRVGTSRGVQNKAHDVLELGRNVKSGSIEQSNKDRFQTYIVKGQGVGNDDKTEALVYTGPTGRKIDSVINRYRPIVIFTETECDEGRCLERAKWEANLHAGLSRRLEYEVQGWTQSNGKVWPLNALVQVKDNFLGIKNKELLIAALSFNIDSSTGTVTKITVVDPNTLDPSAPPGLIATDSDSFVMPEGEYIDSWRPRDN